MYFNSFNLIKISFSLLFFLVGIFLVIDGKNILNSYKKINTIVENILIIDENENLFSSKIIKEKDKKIIKKEKIIIVKKNDTFSKILKPLIKNDIFRNKVIYEVGKKYNLNNLNINQKIIFYLNDNNTVGSIIIPLNFFNELVIELSNKEINIFDKKINFYKNINSLEFNIKTSLYDDGIKAGLPISILSDVIKLYSFDLDFQRDIKKNTIFQISYEKLFNEERNEISYGNIKYINMIIGKKELEYFIFKKDNNFSDYFDRNGKNIKKSLLKTPIDGARLSSNFGMRKHPISGFNKLHKGVDFAAPRGTPIYAGGDGVIDYANFNGGYGKYIKIRHNSEYKTAYAHLSNFKKGIFVGKRVKQGDIIGYVGSTGNSTGPHLHYEILYQDKQINPMKMRLPSGKILIGSELEMFKTQSKDIYAEYLFALYE